MASTLLEDNIQVPASSGPAELRHSPVEHLHQAFRDAEVTGDRAVSLRETAYVTMIGLRIDPASDAASALSEVLGAPLPAVCGQTTHGAGHTVLWQGPDEFLVITDDAASPLVDELTERLGDAPGSVVDLSANRTTLELSGPSARAVLEKSCAVDLHPRAFTPGTAVSTAVGAVPVVLWQTDDAPTYRLLPRSSFADHLGRWLMDGMAEFAAEPLPAHSQSGSDPGWH
jgi:heterotetrameric sarcosine oxidase gamma subunit